MNDVLNNPVVGKIFEYSASLFFLLGACAWLGYENWRLRKEGREKDLTHATSLAEANAARLSDTKEYAAKHEAAREQQRSTLTDLKLVLDKISENMNRSDSATAAADEKTRRLLLDLAEKSGLNIRDYL